MRFESWPFLILLILIPLLHRWWKRRNKPPAVAFSLRIPDSASVSDPVRRLLWLRYIALACIVVALARPQDSFKQTERRAHGIDIVLVMDVSASMNIEDLAERSRLDIAKDTIKDFIRGRTNDRIGFVVFSGEPITLAPPTLDYGLLLHAVNSAETGTLKDGTAIGDGLSLAVSRLKMSRAKSRVIVLLTDGDNNVGQIDPETAGELAAGYGIRVYTIAIGKEGRVRVPFRQKGFFGQTVTRYQWMENALNPELLQKIAESTHGKFYRVTDAEALSSVFSEIDQLEKSEVEVNEKVLYQEMYGFPLQLGLLLLLLEQILVWGWWRMTL